MVAVVICLIGYVVTTMSCVRIYKVVKYHQNQIYWQNQLQNVQTREAHRKRKSAYNSLFVSVVFFCLLFSFFSKENFVSRSQICLRVPNLPEFIIKSYCLLLAVPRYSRNCKKHIEVNNLHEREYDIRKDLKLRIVLTQNVMRSFMKFFSRWKEKQKDTFDLNSFHNFYEMELSKKTNRLAAQKDHENILSEFQCSILNIGLQGDLLY